MSGVLKNSIDLVGKYQYPLIFKWSTAVSFLIKYIKLHFAKLSVAHQLWILLRSN